MPEQKDEFATLRMQVDRLIARCAAKDGEFAQERMTWRLANTALKKELKHLERQLQATQKMLVTQIKPILPKVLRRAA